ncbi:MAG: hypothetical protein KAT48_11575 [Bacteroidales bacterium]|nr:hypothetical protein [Bacteroidales bacterium]
MKTNLLIGLLLFIAIQLFAQTKWHKYPGNPMFHSGKASDWDENLFDFDIIRKDSMYLMWYTAEPADSKLAACIGFAWSADGLTWNNHLKMEIRNLKFEIRNSKTLNPKK